MNRGRTIHRVASRFEGWVSCTNISFLVTVISMTLGGLACNQTQNKAPSRISSTRGLPFDQFNQINNNGQQGINFAQPPAHRTWGQVTSQNSQYLDQMARALVSATGNPSSLGNLQGIRFWGDVRLQSGQSLQSAMSGAAQAVDQNGRLVIAVYDDRVGQVGSDGAVIPPIYVNIAPDVGGRVSGQVGGSQAHLTFEDSYGQIRLVGQISGAYFQGYVEFQNYRSFDGSSGGASGRFEVFQVPACGFFNC